MSEDGDQRLADLFEKLRTVRVRANAQYSTDDVIAVLCLLSRGYNVREIERQTYITQSRITRWRDVFLDGNIEQLYPDIAERMAHFDIALLPPERIRRQRPTLAWQPQTRLEDRANPYLKVPPQKQNGHTD